jgi:hypothetical protein
MTQIIFRELPGVAEVERQLGLQSRDCLLEDEAEELPHLINETSVRLFGITQQDTFYWALPKPLRAKYRPIAWEENFNVLGQYSRDRNAFWRRYDLDLLCEEGSGLHCFEVFGRQLICALHGLHPRAVMAFAEANASEAA